ncbi:MAG: TrkA family potassium uptake protein [Clostridia bacterium]
MKIEKTRKRQFAVLGLGRFGYSVAKTLFEKGVEILAVDEKEDAVLRVRDFVTYSAVADVSDERTLSALGIENFDVVIIAIGNDLEASVLATLACKELGVKKVIAKAQSLKHKSVLERVGADEVLIPEMEMGEKLATRLANPLLHDIMFVSREYSIIETRLPQAWKGKSLAELELRKKYELNVIGIERGGNVIVNLAAEAPFEDGDTLIIGGNRENLEILQKQ